MSIEEIKCNGTVKQEVLSSSDGLLTYRRRKRMRIEGGESSCQQEEAGVSADEEVYHLASNQGKGKDFGWEHGDMVNGNRYHWKCKWCHCVGRSGGVTRLKKHLAGGWQVTPCSLVPKDISKMMNDHLVKLTTKRIFNMKRKRKHEDSEDPHLDVTVDDDNEQVGLSMQLYNGADQSGRVAKSFETDSQQSRDSYHGLKFSTQQLNTDMFKVNDASQKVRRPIRRSRGAGRRSRVSHRRSRTTTRRSNADMVKAMKEPCTQMLYGNVLGQGDEEGTYGHWRNVLEHMQQLLDISEGGGIGSSISEALTHGPPSDNTEYNMASIPIDSVEQKDSHRSHAEESGQTLRKDISANALKDVSESWTHDQTNALANKQKCQDSFVNILCSGKFVSLCNLLCETFQGIKVDKLFDVSQIDSKMKNGAYEQSPGLFSQDLQQMWRKLQKVGEEMVLIASSLSNMSGVIHQKQDGKDLIKEEGLQECENCQGDVVAKHSNDSDTATLFPSCASVPSTKPDHTEASGLYKVCSCKQCGTEADAERSLICDECEAVYHFSCVEPAVQEIPTRSWYCSSCTKERIQSSEPTIKNNQEDGLHDNCVVCERLEISDVKENLTETATADDSRESSVSSMESDEPAEPSQTALSRLCKHCGTCEDEDKRFLICGHSQCPYKFYHIRCLTTNQVASLQQRGQHCWYCPSCLCRACFRDRDDGMIVLCDNCDEAYHIYCMNPPRTTVPKGQWYCLKCNVAKAKEGMKRYEQWILQQHGKKDVRQGNEANRSMDVLLSAVEKLSSEEKLAAGKNQE